jgi:hypothetical protein
MPSESVEARGGWVWVVGPLRLPKNDTLPSFVDCLNIKDCNLSTLDEKACIICSIMSSTEIQNRRDVTNTVFASQKAGSGDGMSIL